MTLALFETQMNLLLSIGGRRTIWSCSYEHSKSRDGCFFDTNVIPSNRWLLCSGMHTKSSNNVGKIELLGLPCSGTDRGTCKMGRRSRKEFFLLVFKRYICPLKDLICQFQLVKIYFTYCIKFLPPLLIPSGFVPDHVYA